jgi:hypothetical protein
MLKSKVSPKMGVIEKMAICYNDCRSYFLNNNFDFYFSLETDIFPQKDIIEELLFSRKKVIGGVYYRDEGVNRKLMIQKHICRSPNNIGTLNIDADEDYFFIDGKIKQTASVGLGCVLINKSVLEKIKFRWEEKRDRHPDSYFTEDCFKNNIDIFAHTNCVCRHDNKNWGIYGIDYK